MGIMIMKSNFEKILKKCDKLGLTFLSFDKYTGTYMFVAHDAEIAGWKPNPLHMRDNVDYKYSMQAWYKAGQIILAADDDPIVCLKLALDYLDKLTK